MARLRTAWSGRPHAGSNDKTSFGVFAETGDLPSPSHSEYYDKEIRA